PADSVFLFDTTSGNGQIESSGSGAVKYDSGIYKSVFFSFDLAGITDSTVMDTVIRRSVRWLIGHLPEVVENEKHKIDIRIYPNPASGQLILHLPSDIERLTLFDISGRQIMRLKPSPKIILNLPAGIYFLQVKTEIHTRTDKIVILK
ncbi:MAG TPA: T9SS type A sorting domain-containing protein, partial [bacterium (Candidatus Stahlbacteria)]|nr:T9SS type A sorting domain-containing protein [Candidatus Stahlbacteria bacterium]